MYTNKHMMRSNNKKRPGIAGLYIIAALEKAGPDKIAGPKNAGLGKIAGLYITGLYINKYPGNIVEWG